MVDLSGNRYSAVRQQHGRNGQALERKCGRREGVSRALIGFRGRSRLRRVEEPWLQAESQVLLKVERR